MDTLRNALFALRDETYAAFQAKLTPSVEPERFIGVRVPQVRQLAKQIKSDDAEVFLHSLPHFYFDENMLHGLLIAKIKDYDKAIAETDRFLPFIDNWAVCDILSPAVFKKHKADLIVPIKKWVGSPHPYTIRFGIEMLMSHYLDDDFQEEYLNIPADVRSEEYYVNMMIAWFFATALTKQWEHAIPYLKHDRLSRWTHNKTIQKALESYRITPEQKAYLHTLKRPAGGTKEGVL